MQRLNLSTVELRNGHSNGHMTFQKLRRIGFSAYIVMCFLVVGFCMTMLALDAYIPRQSNTVDNSTFYASTISFVLGKFTMLVMEKLVRTSTTKVAQDIMNSASPRIQSTDRS